MALLVAIAISLLWFYATASAQVPVTGTSTITEAFTGFAGAATPTDWAIQGTGIRGSTWNGTNQTGGTSGGWYGNANMSFLGSSSASNGNATWLLQNTSGSTITSFSLSFNARMWRSGSASPVVTVSWSADGSSADPAQGALPNALSSLNFSDATTDIATGTTLSQTVSSISITDGQFIHIRFIHSGGANSDNLGWDDVTFTPTYGPTAVRLTRFDAESYQDGVQLTWESGFEVNNLGYHVYREQGGKRTRITPSIIAGSALTVGPGSSLTAGYSYSWFDPNGTLNATYQLEAIDLDGSRQLAEPIRPALGFSKANSRRGAKLFTELAQTNRHNQQFVTARPAEMQSADTVALRLNADSIALQRAIASGNAVKIQVRECGWYRVTQAELVAAGLNPLADARMLQMYVDGVEVPISLSTAGNHLNTGDVLEFYGVPLDTPTTGTRIYWLVEGNAPGLRMTARRGKLKAVPEDESTPPSFDVMLERRERLLYFSNLLNGDAENIFGAPVFFEPVEQMFAVKKLAQGSSAKSAVEVSLQGLTGGPHKVVLRLNRTELGTMTFESREHKSTLFEVDTSLLREGDNVLTLTSVASEADISLIDYVRLTYPHQYRAENNRLRFTAPGGQLIRVEGFSNPNVRVVDVTDPSSPIQLPSLATASEGSYAIRVQTPSGGVRTLLAFTEELSLHPATMTRNVPSSWASETGGADMLIVTHGEFRPAVQPLAALRQSQGLTVAIADIEDVYDEFSYGAHTPLALKSFVAWTRNHWERVPRYLLLVGDSSWDPRNYLGGGENDFVPTKLIDTQFMETASDAWFGDFDNSGISNVAIGRLPARTAEDIWLIVSKIVSYEQERELNAPLRGAVMVADAGFESQSKDTAEFLRQGLPVQEINRAAIGNDDLARTAILNSLNAGPTIVNYYGHGSLQVWTGAGLLDADGAFNLSNTNRLSLYVMMTCLNGFSHDAFDESLSEAALRAPNGGAVAVWASSGFTERLPQFVLNREFYRIMFGKEPVRLGDAANNAKFSVTDQDVRRTWTLLGDPAMRIR